MSEDREDKLCLVCPVRGRCCYFSTKIGDYNIILDKQPCPLLDIDTGLCKDYKNRRTLYEHCCSVEETIGGLPLECLYVVNGLVEITFPKVYMKDVMDNISREEFMTYYLLNNHANIMNLYGKPMKKSI